MPDTVTNGALDPGAWVVASSRQISADVGGEVVVLDLRCRRCFGLAGLSAWIWKRAVAPARVGDLEAAVLQEFDVEPARVRGDVRTVLIELERAGLVEIRDVPERVPGQG